MSPGTNPRATMGVAPPAAGLLAGLALAKLLIHLPAMTRYGYFRDELYYLASTEHLDFGYVDHPPLSIAVLAVVRWLLGDSLPALRLVPLLAGMTCVVMAGLLARELGGGRAAQGLAALAVVAAPMNLALHHFYSMNALDHLAWVSSALILARLLRAGAQPAGALLASSGPTDALGRLPGGVTAGWAGLGVVLGLGLLNKISILWLGFGLAVGLLAGPARRRLATPGPWVAALVAALLFIPHVAWQIGNDWPTLEFMRNATQQKMTRTPLGGFLKDQILGMNPATSIVWITGLAWCLWPARRTAAAPQGTGGSGAATLPDPTRETRRLFGFAWLCVFALLALSGTARASYLAPAYPMLFAAGGVAIEAFARGRLAAAGVRGRGARRAAIPVAAAVMAIVGAALAPLGLPLIPPDSLARYMDALGAAPSAEERHAQAELPQHFADMFGWQEMAEKVAAAWSALPAEDRARGAVFAQNYGEAGALDVLGRRLGLPPVSSGHNSYWLWGPTHAAPEVILVLGGDEEDNRAFFEELTRVGTIQCGRCMPYERGLGIYVGRKPKTPLAGAWPRLKRFI